MNESFRPRQINCLKLRRIASGKIGVHAPDGRLLEEFASPFAALRWAKRTKDFLRRR